MTKKRKVGRPKGVRNKSHVEPRKAIKVPLALESIFREIINLFKTRK